MDVWWAYLLLGLTCGILSATFGVGSGILMVPALVILFNLGQRNAQGTCLAAMVVISLAGAIQYKLNPNIEINMKLVVLLALGGMAGAMVGSSLAVWLPARVLRKLFAVMLVLVAVRMWMYKPPAKRVPRSDANVQQSVGGNAAETPKTTE
ncbi:MAG: sulfite exporter TauE/SafE family protein [Sedimentisphaerales bacterium]|nr:sulfite exporter TauE/SafE family protein [Sedimentisphaerales bacterium]